VNFPLNHQKNRSVSGDATSDASPASPWRARLAPRGAVSADGGAARALAALGTMQAGRGGGFFWKTTSS